MPRTRSLAWSELKVGILAVIAVVIAATLIFMLGGQSGFPWQRYRLKAKFPNVAGLKPGAPVRVAGVEVGSVKGVDFSGAEVELTMQLTKEIQDRVTTESRAILGTVGLLGEGAVDITASTGGRPLAEGAYVTPGRATPAFSEVATQASEGLEEASRLIADVRQGRGTIGKLFTDQQLYRELTRFVDSAEDVTRNLNRGRGTLGHLLNDPAAARALEASLRNLDEITRRLNSGEGSLGRFLKDESFARSLTSATSNFDTLATKLNRGEGTAGKLLTDSALYSRLTSVADRLDRLAANLNHGEGTAGRLLQDKQLYENMNGTVTELKHLVADIRRDPKKYLNVKVSIF
jgi:phospholipid/cholesterol/gamma-HCH transport system substrate-binding protein